MPGKKVSLNDFISESTSVNTVNVDGRAVELPSAPRSSTLEIDVSKVFEQKKFNSHAVEISISRLKNLKKN